MFNSNDIVSVKKYNKNYIGMIVGVSTTGLIVEFLCDSKPTQNKYKCAVIKEDHISPINFTNMLLDDVKQILNKSNYWTYRITKQDGNNYVITHDLQFRRYNFEVESGVVVKYDIG